jgi:hypothetical protein
LDPPVFLISPSRSLQPMQYLQFHGLPQRVSAHTGMFLSCFFNYCGFQQSIAEISISIIKG